MATRRVYRPSFKGSGSSREIVYAGWLKKVRGGSARGTVECASAHGAPAD